MLCVYILLIKCQEPRMDILLLLCYNSIQFTTDTTLEMIDLMCLCTCSVMICVESCGFTALYCEFDKKLLIVCKA